MNSDEESVFEPTDPEDYIPVLASNYVYPIVTLLTDLNAFAGRVPNEVQTSIKENGYSVSVIALGVLMLESAMVRSQAISGKSETLRALVYLDEFSNFPIDRIKEVSVIRDVIAHNHIWNAKTYFDENAELRLISANLRTGSGDKKFRNSIDLKTRQSKILGLNLFPTRIHRADAMIVLDEVLKFMDHLNAKIPNSCNAANTSVRYKGKFHKFSTIISQYINA